MSTILTIDHLNKSFNHKNILKDINLQIQSGTVVALVGANGAGKTTLINTILNLIPSDSGKIQFSNAANWKEITGVMMQDNITLNRLTVKELLNLSRSYFKHPLPYQKLLNISGLIEQQNTLITKLSGGQKRRLSFALALSGDPQLLFLDEPTVGMDSNARNDLWQEIDTLRKHGTTIFVTSHYLEELENIADRFLILQNGSIAFDGTIQELRNNTGKSMVEFDSQLSPQLFNDLGSVSSINQIGHHYQIITNDPNELVVELTPYIKGIENLQIKQTALDTMLLNYKEEPQHV